MKTIGRSYIVVEISKTKTLTSSSLSTFSRRYWQSLSHTEWSWFSGIALSSSCMAMLRACCASSVCLAVDGRSEKGLDEFISYAGESMIFAFWPLELSSHNKQFIWTFIEEILKKTIRQSHVWQQALCRCKLTDLYGSVVVATFFQETRFSNSRLRRPLL